MKNVISDKRKFWLACFLCVSGVVLMFVALFVEKLGAGIAATACAILFVT